MSTWRSITGPRGIWVSIAVVFAATPACLAMVLYLGTDWFASGNCWDPWVTWLNARCYSDLRLGFIVTLAIAGIALGVLYWFVGSTVFAVLFLTRRDAGKAAFFGMAVGSVAATITLLLSCLAVFLFSDLGRVSLERDLFRAHGTASSVRAAIDGGADVDARNKDGNTPLHTWSGDRRSPGDIVMVRVLVDAGADVNARDKDGRTPLHTWSGDRPPVDPVMVRVLVDAGADVNARDKDGRTPLYKPAQAGRLGMVRVLVDAGADVNARDDGGESPLHSSLPEADSWAPDVINALPEMVWVLVDAGADVNARDEVGYTPLHNVASWWIDPEVTRGTIQALLDGGADVNARDNNGGTPLHRSVTAGVPEVVQELLDAGADVDARDNDGRTPLHSSVTEPGSESLAQSYLSPEVVQVLIDAGADVDARDNDGRTPLHTHAWTVDPDTDAWAYTVLPEVAQALIDAGADVNARDNGGKTPLDLAEERGKSETARILREAAGH